MLDGVNWSNGGYFQARCVVRQAGASRGIPFNMERQRQLHPISLDRQNAPIKHCRQPGLPAVRKRSMREKA